ncbi:hypothetical protein HFP51_12820 [Parasphingopyxis sp. CP4]|uniref:GSCFA domain-containing protein n=1 Tax=Parasphingopyxis sp. CP4 TaxID=2724527 RepID=UPI0015A16C88|nr:GSCFA domain-containing protein [Parasphingopyxis sp. CP4]QLC22990.1 hypothetical protein HFP51_12820 [Parasphingopyxis sp. CP4]
MPLVVHNALDAVRIRKSNPVAAWGNRGDENRIEPVTKPEFDVPFQFKQKERIFTIGSCFARNVEKELLARGFRIPMRELLEKPAFDGVNAEVVNNFGTPSIYNELAWAFGADTFDENLGFVEVQNGKFIDLHMVNSIKPAPIELLRKRRDGLAKAIQMLKKCRILVMTLGLVELWWDNEAQVYLNTTPLPSVLRSWPGRFELHVLTFDECRDYLDRALDLCFAHGHRNLQIILTVSPVPMMMTHRRMDVITANNYSKSVLRTVAEHVVSDRDRLCYFPSYESVTHSDRQIAWTNDFVHVTEDIVAFNVERMVNAFTGKSRADANSAFPAEHNLPSESVDALILAERAIEARIHNDEKFFADNAAQAAQSPAFRLEYARYLVDRFEYATAARLLLDDPRSEARLVRATALLKDGDHAAAFAVAESIASHDHKGDLHWRTMVEAAIEMGSRDKILETETRWLEMHPRQRYFAKFVVGRALRRMKDYRLALERLEDALACGEKTPPLAVETAYCLSELGEHEAVKTMLEGVAAANEWQVAQVQRLLKKVDAA